jgi:peptidoglycan-associated lipoprotein
MKRTVLLVSCIAVALLLTAGCQLVRPTPKAPKALAPANGSKVLTSTPQLQVEAIKDATLYQWTIEDANDSIITKGTSLYPTWTIPKGTLVNGMKYQWTCKAQNTHGWGKDFDPEWEFTTDVPLPAAPVAVAPANGLEVATATPVLEVQSIADADEYEFIVKDSTGKEVAKGSGMSPSWTVGAGLLADKLKYSWTGSARNAAGWGPGFAPEWTFRVKLPPPPKPPITTLKVIHFDFDKFDIRPGDATTLEDNATWLRANGGTALKLEGYCDPVGTEEYNRDLGLRRANAAKNYLVKLGIDATRLSTISFGKEKLVTEDPAQFELNRRVEFVAK